jgi:hypothetical protein
MDKEKVNEKSFEFLNEAFAGLCSSDIGSRCDELESAFSADKPVLKSIVDAAISILDYVDPEDFIPPTHNTHNVDKSKIDVIGSQTHGVICINYNLCTSKGKVYLNESLVDKYVSFSLGGDNMMTMFLLNLLGHNPALSSLIGKGKYGTLYADGISSSGIHLLGVERQTPQPLQINIQLDGRRAGSICLYVDEPVDQKVRENKLSSFTSFVEDNKKTLGYALVGGAPAGDKDSQNRTYFGSEITYCKGVGLRVGGEPKDKLQGDGLKILLQADDVKPNEGELFLIEQCVLKVEPYSRELKRAARGDGAKEYIDNPKKAIEIYKALIDRGVITESNVWIPTFGSAGALFIRGNESYKLNVKDMGPKSAKVGGSSQGCGNGAWAGYIHWGLSKSFDYPVPLLSVLGGCGMASNLWPGNLGGTARQMIYHKRDTEVRQI